MPHAWKADPVFLLCVYVFYLSRFSMLSCSDEVLLELSFAAIWLAMAHSCNKNAHQQQQQEAATGQLPHLPGLNQHPQPSQRLSGMAVLLCKWLLFRLLLVTSTFSATLVCGRDPVLASCFKTLVAHGQPHATTRYVRHVCCSVNTQPAHASLLLSVTHVLRCMPLQRVCRGCATGML